MNKTKEEKALVSEFAKVGIKTNVSILSNIQILDTEYFSDELPFVLQLTGKRDKVDIEASASTKFTVIPDKSYRQVVLIADEKEHELSGYVLNESHYDRYCLNRGDSINIPSSAIVKIDRSKVITRNDPESQNCPSFWFTIKSHPVYAFTATVPATKHCFLIGYDEPESKVLFVSYLPKIANSVEDAHRILRPKGLGKDAYRIGEFFFDPVGIKKSRQLDIAYEDAILTGRQNELRPVFLMQSRDFGESENHAAHALVSERNGRTITQYVVGYVVDTERRHPPVFFSDWHRVVPNNEIPGFDGAWD